MSKLYQISEDDLVTLERVLPELGHALMLQLDNALRVKLRQVKKILSDVRWDYGPPGQVIVIPAGEASDSPPDGPEESEPPSSLSP